MIDIILLSIAFIVLIIGSYTDIKTREVPDWVNYSIIIIGLGIRLLYSAITFDWNIILYGLYGFGIFLALAYIMFYSGQWGGGDSKLLMGMGALIGLKPQLNPIPLLLIFFINLFLVGAIYGLVWSIVLAIKNKHKFIKEAKRVNSDKKIRRIRLIIRAIAVLILLGIWILMQDIYLKILITCLVAIAYVAFYLWMFVKVIENSCMIKLIEPIKLTGGDWIARDYFHKGKRICGPDDLGIEQKQIDFLIELRKKRKIDRILIKEGMPFVPSFLISFVLSIFLGAWWITFI